MNSQLFIPEKLPPQLQQDQLNAIFKIWLERVQPDLVGDILLQFASREEMLDLSRLHQQKDEPTDVLTFNYNPSLLGALGEKIAGEIIICRDVAEMNAIQQQVTLKEEYVTLLVHGLLHIAGFDHANHQDRIEFERQTRVIMEMGGLMAVSLWSE